MGFFSGLGSFLFGSGSKVRSEDRVSRVDPRQAQIIDFLFPELKRLFGTAEENAPQLSPLELASLQGLENLASGFLTGQGQEPRTFDTAQASIRDILSRDDTSIDDFFRTTVEEPLIRDFNREVIPSIRRGFSSEFFGGERRQAEQKAEEALIRELVKARADIGFQARQADTENRIRAAALTPTVAAGPAALLESLLTAGEVPREQRQAEIENRNEIARLLIGLLGGIPSAENIRTVTQGRKGLLSGVLESAAPTIAKALLFK